MRAIIWKELRENFRWALLGMVLVGLAMTYALSKAAPSGQSLRAEAFEMVMVLMTSVLGAALGFGQVIFDSRQGHWALLVHRPIGRDRVFMGKVVAGLTLYFTAMLLPFFAAAIWASMPGHVAGPFRWGMAVPGLMDILTGVVYYFAGMVTARRAARWYASRCLVLVAAILCSMIVIGVTPMWGALLAIAVAGALTFTVARGSFLAAGEYEPQRRVAKASLGAALLVGIVMVGTGVIVVTVSMFESPTTWQYQNNTLLRDGTVSVVENLNGDPIGVTDLEGHPAPWFTGSSTERQKLLTDRRARGAYLSLHPFEPRSHSYRARPLVRGLYFAGDNKARWYYLSDSGRVEGYDLRTRQFIGSFGPDGFVKAGSRTTDRFTGVRPDHWSRNRGLFVMTSGIYKIDAYRRTVKTLFLPEPGMSIESYGAIAPEKDQPDTDVLVVVVNGTIHLLDHDGQPLVTQTPDHSPPAYDRVTVSLLDEPNRYAMWYYPSWKHFGAKARLMPKPLVFYGPDGQRLASQDVPAIQNKPHPPSIAGALYGLVIPPGPIAGVAGIASLTTQGRDEFAREFTTKRTFFICITLCLLLSGVVSLMVNLRLARRNAMARGRRILWATLGLLMGPSGVLLMLCMQAWPAKLRCDECGVKRLVSLFKCEHCGVGFAPPARDGTEIFD